jgi:hypothetical protein
LIKRNLATQTALNGCAFRKRIKSDDLDLIVAQNKLKVFDYLSNTVKSTQNYILNGAASTDLIVDEVNKNVIAYCSTDTNIAQNMFMFNYLTGVAVPMKFHSTLIKGTLLSSSIKYFYSFTDLYILRLDYPSYINPKIITFSTPMPLKIYEDSDLETLIMCTQTKNRVILIDVATMSLKYTFPFSLSCLKFDEPYHRLFTNSGSVIKVLSI